MKILKIFGLVVGIHVFALILIFANPGCSSSTRPTPPSTETASTAEPPPHITGPSGLSPSGSPLSAAPITFNPDAPAVAASSGSGGRHPPTRPGTPVAGALVSEPVVDVTPATTHTVVSGDNLWNLGKKHGVTPAQLAAVNNLKANAVLKPGQKLIIPGKPASATAAATANPGPTTAKTANQAIAAATAKASANPLKHVVKPGESLSVIARQYGVRQGDIAVLNNITDPAKVNAGTELIIPEWQTPAGKSGKSAQKSDAPATKASTKAPETRPPAINPESETPPPPRPANEIPVIRVDDNPLSPAPRSP